MFKALSGIVSGVVKGEQLPKSGISVSLTSYTLHIMVSDEGMIQCRLLPTDLPSYVFVLLCRLPAVEGTPLEAPCRLHCVEE